MSPNEVRHVPTKSFHPNITLHHFVLRPGGGGGMWILSDLHEFPQGGFEFDPPKPNIISLCCRNSQFYFERRAPKGGGGKVGPRLSSRWFLPVAPGFRIWKFEPPPRNPEMRNRLGKEKQGKGQDSKQMRLPQLFTPQLPTTETWHTPI